MNILPNTPARIYTISAFAIGYILLDEYTPAEQNSLGNWFMLIGQVLCTNSAQQQVINNRTGKSTPQNRHIINDDVNNTSDDINEQINNINKVIRAMQQEIENLKKQI